MASLMQIARQHAEELRNGTAWVIIWKTGRSWNAEAVSLNKHRRTWQSAEDQKRASEIMQTDPQAVIFNGADWNFEKYAVKEIAEEIRWQYEYSVITIRYILKLLTVPKAKTATEKRAIMPDEEKDSLPDYHDTHNVTASVGVRGSGSRQAFDFGNRNRPPPADSRQKEGDCPP